MYLNIAALIFALALIASVLMIQRARATLTPEQLLALEKANSASMTELFLPLLPLFGALFALEYFPSRKALIFGLGVGAAVPMLLVAYHRNLGRARSAGVPQSYATSLWRALGILGGGSAMAVAVWLTPRLL